MPVGPCLSRFSCAGQSFFLNKNIVHLINDIFWNMLVEILTHADSVSRIIVIIVILRIMVIMHIMLIILWIHFVYNLYLSLLTLFGLVWKPHVLLKACNGMYWYIPPCTNEEFSYWPASCCTSMYWYVLVCIILPDPVQGYRINPFQKLIENVALISRRPHRLGPAFQL